MLLNLMFTAVNLVLFLDGYLPLHGSNVKVRYEKPLNISNLKISHFNRTVLMVIDALRFDFVTKNYMPLTSDLIMQNGCLINVKVSSPTVTLPRIKALTTGTVPQFIDIIYNLVNTEHVEESILHSAKKKNHRMVFYGDDTWLKIFPDMFSRFDGTTSFFVTDFYEVDDNVTRHANSELDKDDWDIMILHYLGLDHIGHVHGPFHPLATLKLSEMDKIFYKLFDKISKKNVSTLFLLTGDHGMKDSGGHGGSTYSEMHVPLVILGNSCENEQIDQVDIAPNLAILLNVDIPLGSIGKLSHHILKPLSLHNYLLALEYNIGILNAKLDSTFDNDLTLARQLLETYLNNSDVTVAFKAIELYEKSSKKISNMLIEASMKHDVSSMILSELLIFFMFIISFNNFRVCDKLNYRYMFYIFLLLVRLLLQRYISFIIGIIVIVIQLFNIMRNFRPSINYDMSNVLILILFIQPLTWLSSSFIEEEQQYWYLLLNSTILFQIIKHGKKINKENSFSWFIILLVLRFSQTLNQTGDKWASVPDFSDYLSEPENEYLHFTLLTTSIFLIQVICLENCLSRDIKFFLEKIILVLIYLVKVHVLSEFSFVRIIYLLILLNVIITKSYLNTWILLVCLVSKSHNLCMIPLCVYISRRIFADYRQTMQSIYFHILLCKTVFFMQGNGNSLANIDVTAGYLGLTKYQPFFVGMQIFINVYSLSILIHLLLVEQFLSNKSIIMKALYIERLYSIIMVCFVVLLFRYHISVWTIYAPKLFIEFFHTSLIFVEVLIYKCIDTLFPTKTGKTPILG